MLPDAPEAEIANGESLPQGMTSWSANQNIVVPNRFNGRPWALPIEAPNAGGVENIIYRVGDVYSHIATQRISYLMRDIHEDVWSPIDPRLFDLLAWVQVASGSDEPITLTSGYRTPRTESRIFPHTPRMAKVSPHVHGMAADIRIRGVDPAWIRDAMLSLSAGGVGWYPRLKFVHVDTGPVRHWVG